MSSWRVVGWIDNSEWESVYSSLFFGEYGQKRVALDQISVWRARFAGRIPVAIEATAQLFECHMQQGDVNSTSRRQSMATAVSQFVGLLTERSLKGQGHHTPIHVRGEELGIPEWIINLRHESAHGFVPSFTMLNKAVLFAIEWLRTAHWEEHLKRQREKGIYEDKDLSVDEKFVSVLKKCLSDSKKKSTPQKSYIQRLNSLVSGRPTVAKKLGKILLDFNFIPIQQGNENSNFYTQGQILRLTPWAQKIFSKILDILKVSGVFEWFLLQFCDEIIYSYIAEELRNIWVYFLLDVSEDCTFHEDTWATVIAKLREVGTSEHIVKAVFSIAGSVNIQKIATQKSTSKDQTINEKIPATYDISNGHSSDNIKSWTLFEGDFEHCPLGLMPGQEKASLWQNLSSNMLEQTVDMCDNSIGQVTDATICETSRLASTQQQIQNFNEVIDIL